MTTHAQLEAFKIAVTKINAKEIALPTDHNNCNEIMLSEVLHGFIPMCLKDTSYKMYTMHKTIIDLVLSAK